MRITQTMVEKRIETLRHFGVQVNHILYHDEGCHWSIWGRTVNSSFEVNGSTREVYNYLKGMVDGIYLTGAISK